MKSLCYYEPILNAASQFKPGFPMPMNDEQAAKIAIACVMKVGGHKPVSIGDVLGSIGIGTPILVDNLVDRICNDLVIGVPSVGFDIQPKELGRIKPSSCVVDVANVISNKAISKG